MNPKEKIHRAPITGGAGYIESHITHLLNESDYQIIVFDNLNTAKALA